MEKVQNIWCIIASSRIKGTKTKFENPIILCAYETLEEAIKRLEKLNLEDEILEWEYKLESTNLHFQQD